MNSLAYTGADAVDHIQVGREIFLENGLPIRPQAVTQTHDRGYVIAGLIGIKGGAWATRIDASGKVQWRHVVPIESKRPGAQSPEYTGAVMLPDDSAVLCGFTEIGNREDFKIVGLVTRINKSGHVVSEQLIEPHDGKNYELSYVRRCVAVGDEVILLGTATSFWGSSVPRESRQSGWILALDGQGNIRWEKVVEQPGGKVTSTIVASNQDLLISTYVYSREALEARQVTRFAFDGAIQAQRVLSGDLMFVEPLVADSTARLIPQSPKTASVRTLGSGLEDIGEQSGTTKLIVTKRAYYLADGSLILFGGRQQGGDAFTASIAWVSSDLSKKEEYVFEPEFASNEVADAIPTGAPGEFATVRPVYPTPRLFGAGDKRMGVALTFIRYQ